MRLTKTTIAILAASISVAQAAEDNVMVDLSVLDSLNGAYAAPSEPLFPILPKTNHVSPQKKQKITKKKINAPKPQPVVVTKEVNTQPVVEVKSLDATEEVVVVDVEPVVAPDKTALQLDEVKPEVKDEPNPANTEPAKEEIATPAEEIVVPVAKVDIALPAEDKAASADTKVEPVASPIAETLPKSDEQPQEKETVSDNLPQEAVATDSADNITNNQAALLLPTQPTVAKPDNAIVFAEDVDTLSSEQMSDIDRIVSSFKNDKGNKIAIYSHNVDSDTDSFRKKRISLNRAIEIRSYLLKKGFKNFSIKVVNIAAGSPKVNMVEISEI